MRKLALLILITLLAASGTAAQPALSFLIRSMSYGFGEDQTQLVVKFDVINDGTAASAPQTARVFSSGGDVLAEQAVPALNPGDRFPAALSVPLSKFTPGTSPTIYAAVGLDQLPPENQRGFGNIGKMAVSIPALAPAATEEAPSASGGGLSGLSLDWSNPQNRALIVGIIGVVTVLLWVITVLLRMAFSRPPTFTAWQPPYVITPLVDPNSTNGRRQLWQQHAQSDTLPAPCVPGSYMVRKLLIGSNGTKLSGWRVTSMRINQYDRYGRVARSQTVLPKRTVNALDRAVRKSPSLDQERAQRSVRPVARRLTDALVKKSTRQNAILPVALDIRLMGMHGEVRILFELYACNGGWQEIDHWEPEMRVVNGSIEENFTYTLLGQQPSETPKRFRQRLQDDLTYTLAAMVQAPPPPPAAPDTAEMQAVGK